MRYFILTTALTAAAITGCQSTGPQHVPSVDPFAAYGHTRIAPPTTGSYGVARQNPYYPGAQVQAPTEQMLAEASPQVAPAVNLVDATKLPASQVTTAGYDSQDTADATALASTQESPVRIVERVGPAEQFDTDFRGMTAVDATSQTPRLAANTAAALHVQEVPSQESAVPGEFRPVAGAATIRVVPAAESPDRPLPVRGLTPSRTTTPDELLQPAPTSIRPSATIQAGRFVPLEIATQRKPFPERERIVAAAGN